MKTNPVASSTVPASHDKIAARAREIWVSRGCPDGQDVEIWLLAERELAVPPVVTPPASPTLPAARKGNSSRKSIPAQSVESRPDLIDGGDLHERLKHFGGSPQRSPTAVDLT